MSEKKLTNAKFKREVKDIEKRLRIQRNLSKYIPDSKTRGKVRRMLTAEEKRTASIKKRSALYNPPA